MPFSNAAQGAAKLPHFRRPPPAPFGPPINTIADEAKFHPLVGSLKTALVRLSLDDRKAILNFRLNWLKSRVTAAGNALTAAGLDSDLPTKMDKAHQSHWPLKTIGPRREQLYFRLYLQQKVGVQRGDPELTDTADAYAALSGGSVTAWAADPGLAALFMLQIRCLADVYTRWEVAAKLAKQLFDLQIATPRLTIKEMLARILTFWRVEGDMSLPPENDTLDGSDSPPGVPKVPLPPGRTRFEYFVDPRAHMDCVTWLARHAPFRFPDPWNPADSVWDGAPAGVVDWTNPTTAVFWADMAFNFALAGLDVLWKPDFEQGAELSPFASQSDWAALNWQVPAGRPLADAKADFNRARDRRRALLAAVQLTPPSPPPPPPVMRVACLPSAAYAAMNPTHSGASAEYVGLVLGESIRYMNRLTSRPTRFGAGAAERLPEALVYLLYHCGGAQFCAVLASAVAHAVLPESTSKEAGDLRNSLPADFRDPDSTNGHKLEEIRSASTTGAVVIATAAWPAWGPFLGAPAVITLLDSYIRNETDDVWKSWVKTRDQTGKVIPGPRPNVISYDNLYRHHLALFGGP